MAAGIGSASSAPTRALADALLNAYSLTGQSGFELSFTLEMPHLHLVAANDEARSLFGVTALPVSGEALFDPQDLARLKLVVEPLLRRGEAWSGRLGVRPQAPSSSAVPEPIELRATVWSNGSLPDGSTGAIEIVARRADEWLDLTTDAVAIPDPATLRSGMDQAAPDALDADLRFTPVIDLASGETVQIFVTSHDPSSGTQLRAGQRSDRMAIDDAAGFAKDLFATSGGDAAHVSLSIHRREFRTALEHAEATHTLDQTLPTNGLGFELSAGLVGALHGVHLSRLHALGQSGLPTTVVIDDFPATGLPVTAGLLGAAGAGVLRILARTPHETDNIGRALAVASEADCALIASGVNRPDDVDRLLDAGCEFATGPLFGRALSRGRLNRFLDQPIAAFAPGR